MLIAGSFFERWSKNYGLNYILFLRIPNLAGAVLGHDFVTGFYLCGNICLPVYGSTKKCNEKGVLLNTKIQEIIGHHRPIARNTVILIDLLLLAHIVLYSQRLGLDLPVKI